MNEDPVRNILYKLVRVADLPSIVDCRLVHSR